MYPAIVLIVLVGYTGLCVTGFGCAQLFLTLADLTEKEVLGKAALRPSCGCTHCAGIRAWMGPWCAHLREFWCSSLGPGFERYSHPWAQGRGYLRWQ